MLECTVLLLLFFSSSNYNISRPYHMLYNVYVCNIVIRCVNILFYTKTSRWRLWLFIMNNGMGSLWMLRILSYLGCPSVLIFRQCLPWRQGDDLYFFCQIKSVHIGLTKPGMTLFLNLNLNRIEMSVFLKLRSGLRLTEEYFWFWNFSNETLDLMCQIDGSYIYTNTYTLKIYWNFNQ